MRVLEIAYILQGGMYAPPEASREAKGARWNAAILRSAQDNKIGPGATEKQRHPVQNQRVPLENGRSIPKTGEREPSSLYNTGTGALRTTSSMG